MSPFQNIWKRWSNFGIFEHSKILSLVVIICYYFLSVFFTYFHILLDKLPLFNNNPHKISVATRTVHSILNIQGYIYTLFRINRIEWEGPWHDTIFILLFNTLLNYSVGTAVPILYSTNISKQTLETSMVTSHLKHHKIEFIQVQKSDISARNYKKYYVENNIKLIWISANDKIEKQSLDDNGIILYIHGGGYSLCGPSHIGYCSQLSLQTNKKVLFIDYSKPPNAHIPTQVDQILTAYFYVLSQVNNDSHKIVIAGDSAGAGLCCLLLQKLSFLSLTHLHPIGTLLFSPFVDLTLSGNSWQKFGQNDMIVSQGFASRSGLIACGNDAKLLRSPFVSAIYAPNYEIKSNVMLFVSTTECLYDDSKRLLEKFSIGDEKYKIIYREFHYVPHAFVVLYDVIPEANRAMDDIKRNISAWFGTNKLKKCEI